METARSTAVAPRGHEIYQNPLPQCRLASPLRKLDKKQSSMNHLFLCKPLPAKWYIFFNVLRSYNNEKQSGWSVGGYTGPGAEILIKASWHLKSSVIRQSIWVKRTPFWLSGFRPTRERGHNSRLLANQDTSSEEVIRNMRWWRQLGGAIRFHWGSCVYVTHAICAYVVCSEHAGASFTEPWAVAFYLDETAKSSHEEPLPLRERSGESLSNGRVWG